MSWFKKERYFHVFYHFQCPGSKREGWGQAGVTIKGDAFISVDEIGKTISEELGEPTKALISNWKELKKKEYDLLMHSYNVQNERLNNK